MIWTNINCFYGILILTAAVTACAMYAYYKNTKRPAHDPKKRDFHRAAIFLVPFTWPLFLLAFILLLVLRVILFVLKRRRKVKEIQCTGNILKRIVKISSFFCIS